MLIKLRGIYYFKEIKTKRATYLKRIAQVDIHVTILDYMFQVSSTLCINLFEIIIGDIALRGL